MSSNLIMGESADDIVTEMRQMKLSKYADGSGQLDGAVDSEGPFVRALMRAEAELLVADAAAMSFGTYEDRTPDERRHDALLLILHRMEEHARAA
jgi:hypothetical protein